MFDIALIKTDFFKANTNTDIDIIEALAVHWRSHSGDGSGGSWFSITPSAARWLLHNLKHKKIDINEEENVFFIYKQLNKGEGFKGEAGIPPKNPVIIDSGTNTIIGGVKRLTALALANTNKCRGACMEIEIR